MARNEKGSSGRYDSGLYNKKHGYLGLCNMTKIGYLARRTEL